MAQTGYTPIYLYYSGTSTHVPLVTDLGNGELAINAADGKLFYKNTSNALVTVPLLQSSGSQNGWLSSTDWTTFNNKQAALVSGTNIKTVSGTSLLGSGDVGTIGTAYGGTGLTSFTANEVFYAYNSSVVAQSANLWFDGTNLGVGNSVATTVNNNNGSGTLVVGTGSGSSGMTILSGSATNNAARLTFANSSTGAGSYSAQVAFISGANALAFYNQNAESYRINSSGGVSIGNTTDPGAGNLRFNTTGSNGIYFGSSSQLNDYEEGSFSPRFAGDSTAGTWTGYGYGHYRKVGKTVFIWWEISQDATHLLTGATGNLVITNLPYSQSYERGGASFSAFGNLNLGAGANALYGQPAGANIYLYSGTGGSAGTILTITSNYTTSSYNYGAAVYSTSS